MFKREYDPKSLACWILSQELCVWLNMVGNMLYAYKLQTWQISHCGKTTDVLCNITNYYRSPGSTSPVQIALVLCKIGRWQQLDKVFLSWLTLSFMILPPVMNEPIYLWNFWNIKHKKVNIYRNKWSWWGQTLNILILNMSMFSWGGIKRIDWLS